MSDRLMLPTSLSSGRLKAPEPELSWRTRRDTRLIRTLGLPTFSKAFFVSSEFKVKFQKFERRKVTRTQLNAILIWRAHAFRAQLGTRTKQRVELSNIQKI